MAQLSDFISRIFSADRTQGLSGGAEVVIDQDPGSAFYAARLRKHHTDEDLVESPEHLWATASYGGRKGGLRAHIQAERGDGAGSFTDVLVVVNQADADRVSLSTDGGWAARAERAVLDRFEAWCQKEKFDLLHPERPLRVRFLADGSAMMLGQSFNLGPGEYITGLVPNYYVGPGPRSRKVLAVHLNLPGVWDGYREVGHLYSDQVLFTLGRHWLDNVCHPALREPGLYRLQQYPDGSLVHVISPEVQDRYFVRSDSTQGGASVLTVAEWNGEPVAYIVLGVVEDETVIVESGETEEVERDEGVLAGSPAPSVPPVTPPSAPPNTPPTAAPPLAGPVADAEAPSAPPPAVASGFGRSMLQRTIVPGAMEARILTLQERGALLQKVHFANFMEGYEVYIGPGGRIATQMADPKATLQVRGTRVSLVVADPSVLVGGRPAALGRAQILKGEVSIEVDGNRLQYRDLSEVKVDGWPYLGELRRPGAGAYLEFGAAHRIGRDRRCKVRLPDEPHNDNIAWLPTVGGGATIRSRTGDIPKSRFYTDSIMVASEHAELDLTEEPVLRALARHCYTFVRRNGEYLALFPREGPGGPREAELLPNDEVLVGNCLFQVSYLPTGQAVSSPGSAPSPAEPPRVPLTPSELAGAVDRTNPPALEDTDTVFSPPPVTPGLSVTVPIVMPPPVTPAPASADAPSVERAAPVIPPPPVIPPLPVVAAPPVVEAPPVIPPPPVIPGPRFVAAGPTQPPAGVASDVPASPAFASAPVIALPDPGPRPAPSRLTVDPVAAGALGEPGPAPRPVEVVHTVPTTGLPITDDGASEPRSRNRSSARPPRGDRKPPPPMIIEEFPGFPVQPSPILETPAPAPAPVVAAPEPVMELAAEGEDPVLSVEESAWQVELARPAQLVQVGWMVSGDVIVGNHRGAQIVIPEVRAFPEQAFMTLDYFRLFVRGRKGKVELLQEGDARVLVGADAASVTEDLESAMLEVVRRDANLEPDFDIRLQVVTDATLPDPRARLLRVDIGERLVRALFTVGFPLRVGRRVRLGPVTATITFDGETLRVTDYLPSYRTGDGTFRPFFAREAGRPYRTAPEDGSPVVLRPGDAMIVGACVYQFLPG